MTQYSLPVKLTFTKTQYTNTRVEYRVPINRVGSDNSLVNFISLAESVALAPIVVF